MRGWTPDDLMTKPCAQLNGHVLDLDPLRTRPPLARAVPTPREDELQEDCEAFLDSRGFKRLAAKHAGAYATGWYGHLHKAKGNPFLPDLFIVHEPNDRPPLMVELKTSDRFQPGQREMIERGAWTLCRSFVEFVAAFDQWLRGEGTR